ncbi:MAG TPA: hypothetical protein VK163_13360 [Opitutaceae bacterium]|nr:hypothetical protein [Opitutaceae bacterium]
MATIKIPHYFDVVVALEKAVLEMSRDAGLGLSVSPNRYLLPLQKHLEFSFARLGDRKWSLRVGVEKVGGETKSSAYRIQLWMPNGEFRQEIVHLTGEEQLADLGLRYAEIITSAAAEPEPAVA